jgi:hypothetical protein
MCDSVLRENLAANTELNCRVPHQAWTSQRLGSNRIPNNDGCVNDVAVFVYDVAAFVYDVAVFVSQPKYRRESQAPDEGN